MLAGLLFAIEEASDDPSRLVAALPLAGATVIECQARQLIAAGATQIVVVAERPGAEFDAALQRIGRRGVAVDRVGGAVEVAAVVHPLTRLVMLADGLVAGDAIVDALARGEGEAMLVLPLNDAPRGFERIGGASAWAGIARIDARRLADLAALPADYAPQSTLVRLIAAAGVNQLSLPVEALAEGHAVVGDAAALVDVERRMVAAVLRPGRDWFDRWIAAPIVRLAVPALIGRSIGTEVVAALAGALSVGAIAGVASDRFGWGMTAALAATLTGSIAAALARLRDQGGIGRGLRTAIPAVTAAVALLLGWRCDAMGGNGAALPVAATLVVATALVERTRAAPAPWWGGAASCVLIVAVAALIGWPLAGLVLAECYVATMLALAIETLRRA